MKTSDEYVPTLGEVTAFIDRHGLPVELRGPLQSFLVDYASRRVAVIEPNITNLPSMFADRLQDDTPTKVQVPRPTFADDPDEMTTSRMIDGPTTLVRQELLGRGGMGNVFRAWEPVLNRVLAMKVLHTELRDNAPVRAQFLVEASITAQLAHPGIPPVHAIGEHQGVPCFTMKEVQGRTLSSLIRVVHLGEVLPDMDARAWSESRLIDVFHKVCEAVAYAHARGVVHCDLKPSNIMVGAFGEVMVMDWGVARLTEPAGTTGQPPVRNGSAEVGLVAVAGTPTYMPPEQATGEADLVCPASDVFSLGVILYELLTGNLPFDTNSNLQRVRMAMDGEITPLRLPVDSIVDEPLRDILYKSLAALPEGRYQSALGLAEAIGQWREGSQRRERALARVREAEAVLPTVGPMLDRARQLRDRAAGVALGVDGLPATRAQAWTLEDDADQLEQQASLRLVEVVQKLHGALAHAPELSEAHELLARIHREQHRRAEKIRDWAEAERQEILLRAHDLGTHEAYISGKGQLALSTAPRAEVTLCRYVERERRLVADPIRALGETPIQDEDLTVGSYAMILRAPGRAEVLYPVHIDRTRPWSGTDPAGDSVTIPLPVAESLGEHEVYVPAGWFLMGGDPLAPGSGPRRRVWVDGYVIERTPVCWRDFSVFLASPEGSAARADTLHAGLGLFRADWPATGVSFHTAMAYVRWRAERDGLPWTLPTEAQWEKAARGVDGRWFPWGDRLEPSFTHVRIGDEAPVVPRASRRHPVDRSPYGVMGMAGNTRDWCVGAFAPKAPVCIRGDRAVSSTLEPTDRLRAVRGGSFRLPALAARCAARSGADQDVGHSDVGIRMVRPLL